jgi:hypothetical protein
VVAGRRQGPLRATARQDLAPAEAIALKGWRAVTRLKTSKTARDDARGRLRGPWAPTDLVGEDGGVPIEAGRR